jgi:hypothetical protein
MRPKEPTMTTEKSPENSPETGRPPAEREPYIPKPPTREDVERISREQALITDEWTGEAPDAAGKKQPPETPA